MPAPFRWGRRLGSGAEQRFFRVGLAKALRIGSSSPVYTCRVLRREPEESGYGDRQHSVPPGHRSMYQRALAGAWPRGEPAEHPKRESTVTSQIVLCRTAVSPTCGRFRQRSLRATVVGNGGRGWCAGPPPLDRSSKQTGPPPCTGAGAVDPRCVGDCDRSGSCLHDEQCVSLSAAAAAVVNPLESCGCRP